MGTINYTTSIVGNVTLGADSLTNPTAASTNITLGTANSIFRLYTPITPSYPISFTSDQIGYSAWNTVGNGVSPTGRTYAPINNLVSGVYLTNLYLYNSGSPVGSTYLINLVDSFYTINNGDEYLGNSYLDGGQESQATKNTQNVGWSMKAGGVVNITTNRNIGLRAFSSSDSTSNFACVLTLKATRIA